MATPIQVYYVPFPESDLILDFDGINSQAVNVNGAIQSLIAIAIAAPGTVIWYDHWEDGYDVDYTNLSPDSTTHVWGDTDLTNDFSASTAGLSAFVTGLNTVGGEFSGGEAIILENAVDLPRVDTEIFFDGGDRIVVSFPVAVTRAAYPTDAGSLMAGAVEVFATDKFGTSFVVPVGENTANDDTDAFQQTVAHVMAAQDATDVTYDGNTVTLNAGESVRFDGVDEGAVITATKGVQVSLTTGDVDSNYEMRWFALTPRDQWSDDYVGPLTEDQGNTGFWLYNPNSDSISIDVGVKGDSSFDTVVVSAGESAFVSYDIGDANSDEPGDRSGIRFTSDDGSDFFALAQIDADGSGQAWDWGHPLVAVEDLTSQALIGLGYGNTNNLDTQPSYSRVYVTAVNDATITVDYDGDGSRIDTFDVVALENITLFDDVDEDMSGAVIFATVQGDTTPVDIAVAWGQDPNVVQNPPGNASNEQANSLDLGTVVLPLPELTAGKSVALGVDVDGDGQVDPGDTLTWTIAIQNVGRIDLEPGSYQITDDLGIFAGSDVFDVSDYLQDTTFYTYTDDDGIVQTQQVNDSAITVDETLFPLDETGPSGQAQLLGFVNTDTISAADKVNGIELETQFLTFQTKVKDFADLPGGTVDITNFGELSVPGADTAIIRFSANAPIPLEAKIDIEKFTNGEDADNPTGPDVTLGDQVTWTYEVRIPDAAANTTYLANVVVTDDDADVDPMRVRIGENDDGDALLEAGEVWYYEATGVAETGQYMNTGTATGDPVYADGTPVAGVANPEDSDDSHYIGVLPTPTISVDKLNDANGDETFTDNEQTTPGDTVTFQGAVTNTSIQPVTITKIEDNLHQAGIDASQSVDDLIGTLLQPGETATFTFEGTIADQDNLTEVNTLTVTVTDDEENEVTGMDTSTVTTPDEQPTISVDKLNDANGDETFTDNEQTTPGDTVTFQGAVTNTSDEPVTITKIEDNLHQAGIDASQSVADLIGTLLQPGETATFTFEGTIADQDNLTEVNTLTVTVTDDEENEVTGMDTSTVTTPDEQPTISVDKLNDANGDETFTDNEQTTPGDTVTFQGAVTNTSDEPVTITKIEDNLHQAGIDASQSVADLIGTLLQPGETATFTFEGTIADQDNLTEVNTLTVTVTDDEENEVTGMDTSTVTTPDEQPTISVDKLNDANGDETFTDNEQTTPGDTVTFQGAVTNTSDEPVTITKIEDNLHQAGIDASQSVADLIGTLLQPGETATFTFEGTIADQDNLTEVNTLTVTVTDDEENEVTGMDTSTVTTPDEQPTISVDKLNDANGDETFTDNEQTTPGDTVTFQGAVTNTSDEPVTITKIEDNLHQAGIDASQSVDDLIGTLLQPGETATFTFEGTIADQDNLTEVNTLTVTVTDDEENEVTGMDTSTVTTPDEQPTISVDKLNDANGDETFTDNEQTTPGDTVTFQGAVTNTSDEPVTITKIEDNLHQAGIDASQSVDDLIGTLLQPGETATFTFEGTIADQDNLTEVNTLTVTVTDDEENEVTGMDTSTVTTPDEQPTISVDKLNDANGDETFTDNEQTTPGDTVTFQGAVTNTSDEPVTITKIEDNLHQAGIDASQSVDDLIGTLLQPGETATFTFEGTIADQDNLTEVNTLTVTVTDDEENEVTGMDTSTVTTPDEQPTISVDKLNDANGDETFTDNEQTTPGDTVTFQGAVTNTSDEPVTITKIEDNLHQAGIDASQSVDDLIGTLLQPGETATFTFEGTIADQDNLTEVNTLTVTVTDDEENEVTGMDTSTVTTPDEQPTISVDKLNDANGDETFTDNEQTTPGDTVTFQGAVTNTSDEPVTITKIEDNLHQAGIDASQSVDDLIGTLLQPGETATFTFEGTIADQDNLTEVNTLTVTVTDDEENEVTGMDTSTVTTPDTASLGDKVFEDLNGDGVQDTNEPGIAGVNVELLDVNGDPTGDTVQTDSNGNYIFTGLAAGDYRVGFTLPADFEFTFQNVGSNDAVDSDVNAAGVSDVVTLEPGEINTSVDAGLIANNPDLDIEKFTNGVDADTDAEAALIAAGDQVIWTYEITNTGNVSFDESDIVVSDDQEGLISTIIDDGDGDTVLAPGETWIYEKRGAAQNLVTVIDWETDLDGNPLAPGTFITDQFQAAGLTVSATEFGAMIFDSANPTGGDTDLATANLKNIVIISADGDQSDPDDNENGGVITFDWENPIRFDSTLVLDIEEAGSTIETYDANGALISTTAIPTGGDGELARIDLDEELVSRIEFDFAGSGATVPEFTVTDIYRNTATVSVGDIVFDSDNSGYINPAAAPDEKDIKVGIFNTSTDQLVTELRDGDVFATGELTGDALTLSAEVIANSDLDGEVGSMRLRLTGEGYNKVRVESVSPYALFGDNKGDFFGGIPLGEGDYVFTIDVFSGAGAKGALLDTCFISFSVSDEPNTPPEIAPITVSVNEDDPSTQINLLQGATDTDGDTVELDRVQSVIASDGRTVAYSTSPAGVFQFDPGQFNDLAEDEPVSVVVQYEITDGKAKINNTATVNVTGENDNPEANDDTFNIVEGTPSKLVSPLANDSDVDGDDLSVTSISDADETAGVGETITLSNGATATLNADGSVLVDSTGVAAPSTDTFDYLISDGKGGADTAVVTVEKEAPQMEFSLTQKVSFDGEQGGTKGFDTVQGGRDNDLEIGKGDQTGLVFEDVAIAAGATITSASLTLTSQRKQGGKAEVEIRLFDEADAIANSGKGVLTDPGFDQFNFVEFEVTESWAKGDKIETPDLSSLIQNLIENDPQQDGTYDLSFALAASSGIRRIEAEEFGNDLAAELNLVYEIA